jgi:hypothetical protein
MVKLTAADVVDKLLEYAGEVPLSPRAGSADDPWRQGGFKKFKFTAKDVLRGDRPGTVPHKPTIKIKLPPKAPGEPESGLPPVQKMSKNISQRFQWKPGDAATPSKLKLGVPPDRFKWKPEPE